MDEASARHYDRMMKTPVPKLILSLAMPTIATMLVTNIYNLVDTYFIGRLGVSQSGAVGIIFTLMSVLQAVAFMFGHGAGSLVSRRIAAQDLATANEYVSTGFFCAEAFGVLFLVVGIPLLPYLVVWMGATETIAPYAQTYALYILLAAPAIMGSFVINNLLRYEGKAFYAMFGLIFGAFLNMAGDPLLIFVCRWGMHGAGVSTMVSQYVSFILLWIIYRKRSMLKLSPKNITRRLKVVGTIMATGFPSLLRQGLSSVAGGILNNVAKGYGDGCVAAMSIVSRLQGLMLSFILGMGQGFQPVAGFTYQVRAYDRLKKAFYFTLFASLGGVTVMAGLCALFAPQLVQVFIRGDVEDAATVIAIGTPALRYTCAGMVAAPLSVCPNMLFQSAGLNGRASFVALLRSGLFFIPCLLILPALWGLTGLQLCIGVSDILSALVATPIFIVFFVKLTKQDTPNEEKP